MSADDTWLSSRPNRRPSVCDGCVVHGHGDAANPDRIGTKAAAHYEVVVPPGGVEVFRLRLGERPPSPADAFGEEFDDVMRRGHRRQPPERLDRAGRLADQVAR